MTTICRNSKLAQPTHRHLLPHWPLSAPQHPPNQGRGSDHAIDVGGRIVSYLPPPPPKKKCIQLLSDNEDLSSSIYPTGLFPPHPSPPK